VQLNEFGNILCVCARCLHPNSTYMQGEHEGEGGDKVLIPSLFKVDAAFFGERDNVTVSADDSP